LKGVGAEIKIPAKRMVEMWERRRIGNVEKGVRKGVDQRRLVLDAYPLHP